MRQVKKQKKTNNKIRIIQNKMLRKQQSLDSLFKPKRSILSQKDQNIKSSHSVLKLPQIETHIHRTTLKHLKSHRLQNIDQKECDKFEVSKLQEWTLNKPTKKSKTILNTHNISFLYKSPSIVKQKGRDLNPSHKFMEVQLYIAKIDNQLQKIGQINYFSIYKNLEYCCGVYQNCFNTLLKTLAKHRNSVQTEVDQIQLKLEMDRQDHLNKVHLLQENPNQEYKTHMNQVSQLLEQREINIKPLKKILEKIDSAKIKVLKYCLSLGYDVRKQGLTWILRQLGSLPKPQEFPSFLSSKETNFIIAKYTNQNEDSHAEYQMKKQICGKTINQAYEHVNRRKRRELSLIKQNDELIKIYADKIKDYTKEKHHYLNDSTLQIAQQLQKEKPKPTRYEVIYKEAAKKLNKICREKIHPQIDTKSNKENKNNQKQDSNKIKQKTKKSESAQDCKVQQLIRKKQKRKSSLIIEEFSEMLNLSISRSKKLDELYSNEEKQFQQILRQIRNEKYKETTSNRGFCDNFDELSEEQRKLRNPISIIGCLVGWKKAQKIIEQEMLGF